MRYLSKLKYKWIIFSIIFSGFLQALYGILQYLDILPSNNSYFLITGSLFNPGPYGGFLVISFILAIGAVSRESNICYKICFIFVIIFIGFSIYLSDSRAAWVSIIGCFLLLLLFISRKYIKIVLPSIVLIAVGVSILLYNYRPNSADSRVFIWTNSINGLHDDFIFGNGINSFRGEYMYLQAEYFKNNQSSYYFDISGNNSHAFNDFLKILYEQGIIGFFLFCLIFVVCFRRSLYYQVFIKLSLVGLIIFSCFSYPSDVFPLKMLFPILIGMIKTRRVYIFPFTLRLKIIFTSMMLLLTIHLAHRWIWDKGVSKDILIYYMEGNPVILKKLKNEYSRFKNNHYQVRQYAKVLFDNKNYQEAYPALLEVAKLAPSTDVFCDLGEIYKTKSEFNEAEECFKLASNMVPTLITPYYKLFCLYKEIGEKDKAASLANKIIKLQEKRETDFTKRIKREAELYINNNQNKY